MLLDSIDLNPILELWYLLPIIIIVSFFKTSTGKGILGEFLVNIAIRFKLDKNTYYLINNVTLPTEDGTTQIDHIIVSKYGLFIIETKNMSGWIFGNEKQKYWTQKIYKTSNKFQNPLHQNYKHIKTIESSLNISIEKIFSVIVFVGDSSFKTKVPTNVVQGMDFINYIKTKNNEILSSEEVKDIITSINSGRLSRTYKTYMNHSKHVKKIIKDKDNICVKCGSKMILRVAKRGSNIGNSFYGCSNYPKCRYIKDK